MARAAVAAGISVVPPAEDGTKRPDGAWKRYHSAPPTIAELDRWYGSRTGLGYVCGAVSGGLELFEFDADLYAEFKGVAHAVGLGPLLERIETGYLERSPSGGWHMLYRCDELRGNTKLAQASGPRDPVSGKPTVEVLIETRGEGGYAVVAPSNGRVHPSGRAYEMISGGPETICTITGEERDALWAFARTFDRMPAPQTEPTAPSIRLSTPPASGTEDRPGDDYNARVTWDDVIGARGWRKLHTQGDTTYWRRPGKSEGWSATTNRNGSGLLWVFSSSTEFEANRSYDRFGAYAVLEAGGNLVSAARSLSQQGYGAPPNPAKPVRVAPGKQEPDDGPSEDIVDRWPQIDEAAYHGIAGEIVRGAGPHTEADPVAVLVQFLVAFANAVGRGPYWVAGATRHYLVLFAALVGATAAGRKGSSWDVVRFFAAQLDEEWSGKRVTRGLSSGEGLIYHVRDKVTKLDADKKEVIEDPGVDDKRLLAIESELARTLKVMGRESNTLSAVLRQAWDCDERLATLTKNSTNLASYPHISVIGHITGDELHTLMTNTESANGFGNRFLWACVRRSKELPEGGAFYQQDWTPIIHRLQGIFDHARGISLMTRDEEATAIWRTIYADLSGGKPGLLGAMLARAEAQVMRIACIYALLDSSRQVQAVHLQAALAVWEYAEASARFIFGESLGDPNAEKLIQALKAAPDGLKKSEISIQVFAKNLPADRLKSLLEHLLGLGLIHRVQTSNPIGRKAELWFAGRAARETK